MTDEFHMKSSDGKALVTNAIYWKRITSESPFGVKCLLINEHAGSWFDGILSRSDNFSTHYAPAPKFHPEDKKRFDKMKEIILKQKGL